MRSLVRQVLLLSSTSSTTCPIITAITTTTKMSSHEVFDCPRAWVRSGLVADIQGIPKDVARAEFEKEIFEWGLTPHFFVWAGQPADDEPHSGRVWAKFGSQEDLEDCLEFKIVRYQGKTLTISRVEKPTEATQITSAPPGRPADTLTSGGPTSSALVLHTKPAQPEPRPATSVPASAAAATSTATNLSVAVQKPTASVSQPLNPSNTAGMVLSVNPVIKAALSELVKLNFDKIPREWVSHSRENRENAIAAFHHYLQKVEPALEKAGTKSKFQFAPRVPGDYKTKDKLMAQSIPSPAPMNDHLRDEVFVWVERDSEDLEDRYKMINLKDLPAEAKNGWALWEKVPTIYQNDPDGKEHRKVERPKDCCNTDEPWKDIGERREPKLALLQLHERADFRPGDLLDRSVNPAETVSFAPSFKPPSQMPVQTSATSNGHVHKHGRPGHVGLGWGGYDKFDDWQSHGRQIKLDMVEQSDPNPSYFAKYGEHDLGDERILANNPDYVDEPAREVPKTLYEKLVGLDKKQQHTRQNPKGGWSSGKRRGKDYGPRPGDKVW